MAIRFTFRQLEYFVAVGETGSIALAAERVNVSSPSISTSIAQLEAEMGVRLFVRKHAQGLSLTSGGRRFLAEAKEVLASAHGLKSLAADISENVSGPLNVGCLSTLAPIILPELRRHFENQYPDVIVKQVGTNQAALLKSILNADLDVCLTYDLNIPNDVHFETLIALPPYVMLSLSHPLAGQASITPEELADEPMVLLDLPISNDYFLSVFDKIGVKPNIAERIDDFALVRSMVANGFGYSLANIRPRTEYSPDGKLLKLVPLAGGIDPINLGMITGNEKHTPRTLTAFKDLCREVVASGSIPALAEV